MSIDWDKAPEGATHYRAPGGMYYGGFYKREPDGQWFFYVDAQWEFLEKPEENNAYPLIPRPKPQSSEWDEAGEFPPTGERVDACVYGEWQELLISGYGNKFCIGINGDGEDIVFEFSDDTFRPIRTQAEREREELADLIRNTPADVMFGQFDDAPYTIADAILAKYELKERTNDN